MDRGSRRPRLPEDWFLARDRNRPRLVAAVGWRRRFAMYGAAGARLVTGSFAACWIWPAAAAPLVLETACLANRSTERWSRPGGVVPVRGGADRRRGTLGMWCRDTPSSGSSVPRAEKLSALAVTACVQLGSSHHAEGLADWSVRTAITSGSRPSEAFTSSSAIAQAQHGYETLSTRNARPWRGPGATHVFAQAGSRFPTVGRITGAAPHRAGMLPAVFASAGRERNWDPR